MSTIIRILAITNSRTISHYRTNLLITGTMYLVPHDSNQIENLDNTFYNSRLGLTVQIQSVLVGNLFVCNFSMISTWQLINKNKNKNN